MTSKSPPIGDGPHSDGPELVGYARVSTRSQKDDSQIADLTAAGCSRIFTDQGVSGKLAKRPELDACVAYLRPGDTFVITRLSRAMRSLKHLLQLADDFQERGIGLKVLKQEIDTTTTTGRLVFRILGAIDEWQRELIVEGTLEGLAAARSNGKHGGHPRALTPEQEDAAMEMLENGKSMGAVARQYQVSRPSIRRAAVRRGLLEDTGEGQPRPAISDEDKAEMLRILKRKEGVSAAAAATGYSRTTVRRVWHAAGNRKPPPPGPRTPPPRKQPKITAEQAREARQLLADGYSVRHITGWLEVSRETLYRAWGRLDETAPKPPAALEAAPEHAQAKAPRRRKRPAITPEQAKEAERLLIAGEVSSVKDAAAHLNVSTGALYDVLKDLEPATPEQVEEAKRLFLDGKVTSIRAAAQAVGVTNIALRQALLRIPEKQDAGQAG
jgi:DNA invertase Pin-like site-specific DNA recombinase